jgi:uncharacterized protein (TIGR01244 family)
MRLKNLEAWAVLAAILTFFSTAGFAAGKETFKIMNATFPEPGMMAAGQPSGEQIQLLAEEGYKTIVDLRTPGEPRGFDEPEAARQNGMAYENIPVNPEFLESASLDRFFEVMKKAEQPVLIHCGSSNRVGAFLYAWWVLEKGVPATEAMANARAAGLQPPLAMKIQKLVEERQAGGK